MWYIFSACGDEDDVSGQSILNGGLTNIAGLVNKRGNVPGIMPHPERAAADIWGSADGLKILRSGVDWFGARV